MIAMSTPEPSTIEAFDEALRAEAAGDEDRRWELVSHLHVHGGREALDVAARWSGDRDAARRRLAADVLGQLGAAPGRAAADGPFREDALTLLLTMARNETTAQDEPDSGVLSSITIGLGHIGDVRSLEPLVELHVHPDAEVRYSVAFALLRRPEPAALDALITLSADEDVQVRDWATFGLARQTDEDFPRLREALAARLADDDVDTRVEALHGLATRGDERARQPLLDLLESPPESSDPELISEALSALRIAGPRR
jgi:HEAT repeat protein